MDNRKLSEMASKMKRQPVEICLSFGRKNVKKLRVLLVRPIINERRYPHRLKEVTIVGILMEDNIRSIDEIVEDVWLDADAMLWLFERN